jgi:NADPH:quinone reductase-like Zn-dependent oxidoreductase
MMKAFAKRRYGAPDLLRLEERDRPVPTEEQVLVRVHASAVNAHDWHMVRGKPYIARLSEGVRRPKDPSIGLDVAGVAEEVGSAVTHVKTGDRVFGSRYGAFAEFVAGKTMIVMPPALTFEQAAAIPTAGYTALQGLRDKGGLQAGQHVLVNGAGGGVGTMAVQIGKALGAEVTAVTSASKLELARSLGADHVIDHGTTDITRNPGRYDLVLDIGGTHSLSRLSRIVTGTGTIVLVGPGGGQWIGPIARILGAIVRTRLGRRPIRAFIAEPNRPDLEFLRALVEAGSLTPVIERTYPFERIPEAIAHVESGGAHGKVIITMPGATAGGTA